MPPRYNPESLGHLIEGKPHKHGVCVDWNSKGKHVKATQVWIDQQYGLIIADKVWIWDRFLASKEHHPVYHRAHSIKAGQNFHLEFESVLRSALSFLALLLSSEYTTFQLASIPVHYDRCKYEQKRLKGVNAYQSVDLPVIALWFAGNAVRLDKYVDSLEKVKWEKEWDVHKECDLSNAWMTQWDQEPMEKDWAYDGTDHGLDQAAEDKAGVLEHEKSEHSVKQDL